MPVSIPREFDLLAQAQRQLAALLPPLWKVRFTEGDGARDAVAVFSVGDQTALCLDVEVKVAATSLRHWAPRSAGAGALVVAPFISPTWQARLSDAGASFVDATGNVLVQSAQPGLLIRRFGASRDPSPQSAKLQSLRGRGASRAVRAFVDFAPPYSLRTLSVRAKVSVGSLARVSTLLSDEGLLRVDSTGEIREVDWAGALRRWAQDYDFDTSNTVQSCLAPRGLDIVRTALREDGLTYALTGSAGAEWAAPIAATRQLVLYVAEPLSAAERLDLEPADLGANVVLARPYDPVVFERTRRVDDLVVAAPSQVAVDLLTRPGREPSQAVALLQWMEGHVDAWRS